MYMYILYVTNINLKKKKHKVMQSKYKLQINFKLINYYR